MSKLMFAVDLGCFKGYRVFRDEISGSDRVEKVSHFNTIGGHGRFGDRVSDQAGRFATGTNGKAGGMSRGEHHGAVTESERRLVKQLADKLSDLVSQEGCEQWYLAASKRINHRLVDSLAPQARKNLKKNLTADLTKLEGYDLLERFDQV